jgi:hypothetical protein
VLIARLPSFSEICASCQASPFSPISAGHSQRAIPAPGALLRNFLLRTRPGLDSFPKTSSGPLPKNFRPRLGSGPLAFRVPRQSRANERRY